MRFRDLFLGVFRDLQNIGNSPVAQESKLTHIGHKLMRVSRIENQLQATGIQWRVRLTSESGDTLGLDVSQSVALGLHSGEDVEVKIILPVKN